MGTDGDEEVCASVSTDTLGSLEKTLNMVEGFTTNQSGSALHIHLCWGAEAGDRLCVLCLRENFKAWLLEMRAAAELLHHFHSLESRPGLSRQVRWAKLNTVSLGSLDKV